MSEKGEMIADETTTYRVHTDPPVPELFFVFDDHPRASLPGWAERWIAPPGGF